jgi:SM-20-related protein
VSDEPAPAAEVAITPAQAFAQAMRDQGFAVIDDFIDHKTVVRLRTCADLRSIRGEFRAAAIGAARQRRDDIRGDFTCWLQEPLFPAEREAQASLDRLRLSLNEQLLLGLFDTEVHYATYPPGAAYGAHVDQPTGNAARQVSFALYLNLDWDARCGGELRLHDENVPIADIEPRGGRLCCFLTPGRLHEVLPSTRVRMALSGWFRTRAEI